MTISQLITRIKNLRELDTEEDNNRADELTYELHDLVKKELCNIQITIVHSGTAEDAIKYVDWIVDELMENPTQSIQKIVEDEVEKYSKDYSDNLLITEVNVD